MKTQPIVPAQLDFRDPAAPRALAFGEVYPSGAGAFQRAQHVFLGGNGLPERWRGRTRFVVLETGFGLGNNFLATWAAWRADAQKCERLVFISIEKHPISRADMERAHQASPESALAAQLVHAWPPLTHNLHRLGFELGRVQLLLALGDARAWAPELVAAVDAFYLDGFAPERNPEIWDTYLFKSLARLAAPGATAATWNTAHGVQRALVSAGFTPNPAPGFGGKGLMTVAAYTPRHQAQRPAAREPLAADAREVIVIGAGLAGAACAAALAEQGIHSTVIEARAAPALASSGNPAGLFHGTVNPDDGLHARFNRAAALATERNLSELSSVQWGLLRLEQRFGLAQMQAQIERLGLPANYVQALAANDAAARSGLPLNTPAWFYPGGGALSPSDYVRVLLTRAGADLKLNSPVASLQHLNGQWWAAAADGRLIASAPALVMAGGHESLALLQSLTHGLAGALPPLLRQRGQMTQLPATPGPRVPVAGAGYALSDGAGGLICGATHQDEDFDPELRASDQTENLAQWAALTGKTTESGTVLGRVGWRLIAPDRLPLVGGLPAPDHAGRSDQPRLLPRLPGLAVCTALASRGIGWAALCGQVIAAQISGAPLPLEASLADAIDPARFAVRGANRSK